MTAAVEIRKNIKPIHTKTAIIKKIILKVNLQNNRICEADLMETIPDSV